MNKNHKTLNAGAVWFGVGLGILMLVGIVALVGAAVLVWTRPPVTPGLGPLTPPATYLVSVQGVARHEDGSYDVSLQGALTPSGNVTKLKLYGLSVVNHPECACAVITAQNLAPLPNPATFVVRLTSLQGNPAQIELRFSIDCSGSQGLGTFSQSTSKSVAVDLARGAD